MIENKFTPFIGPLRKGWNDPNLNDMYIGLNTQLLGELHNKICPEVKNSISHYHDSRLWIEADILRAHILESRR